MHDDFSKPLKDLFNSLPPGKGDMPASRMLQDFREEQNKKLMPPSPFFIGALYGVDYLIEARIREWMRREENEKREERERREKNGDNPKPPQP